MKNYIIKCFKRFDEKQIYFNRNYFYNGNFYKEEWIKIPNFDYLVSNYGRIRNLKILKLKKLKYQRFGMQVILWSKSKGYTITMSRLVAELFIRPLKKNERVFHKNYNIRDNYYKNLYIQRIR